MALAVRLLSVVVAVAVAEVKSHAAICPHALALISATKITVVANFTLSS